MKRTSFEKFLIASVVALSVVLSLGLYKGRTHANDGQRLMGELSMLRSGVTLYKTFNKRYPSDLKSLLQETYTLNDQGEHHFVENMQINEKGELMDPFGHAYAYDPLNGWVRSMTEGYDQW